MDRYVDMAHASERPRHSPPWLKIASGLRKRGNGLSWPLGPGGDAGDEWEIDSFLMSCRAFGRKIESELLRTVLDDARRSGVRLVRANRIPTAKNGMTRNFYPDHGFSEIGGDGEERYAIDLAESIRRRADGQGQGLYRVTLCGFDATTPQRIPEPRSSRTP